MFRTIDHFTRTSMNHLSRLFRKGLTGQKVPHMIADHLELRCCQPWLGFTHTHHGCDVNGCGCGVEATQPVPDLWNALLVQDM